MTGAADGFNDTWMFLETIPSGAVAREALVHELGHQWMVNHQFFRTSPRSETPGGHCDSAMGCGMSDEVARVCQNHNFLPMAGRRDHYCLMTASFAGDPNNADGEVGFHYVKLPNGQPDSEWLRIRRRKDPVPQSENLRARDAQ